MVNAFAPRRLWPSILLALVFGAFSCGHANAEPLTLSSSLENRFSDNVTKASSNESSDIETRVDLQLSHQRDPGVCQSDTYADLGYGIWHDKTYDPETYTTLDFQGRCELTEGLNWELGDNLRNVTQNSQGTDTPDNRTRKNIFRTGPVYVVPITLVDQLRVAATYENTEFSEPEAIDSDRLIGSASWNRLFSPSFSAGLSVSTNKAEFDTGAETTTNVVSLLFSQSWSTTRLSGSLGVSEIEGDFGGTTQKTDGFVGSVDLERDINLVTTAYLSASRELTDQTSDFDVRFGEFVFDLQEISEVEVTAIDAGVRRQFSDASLLNLSVFANRADYIRTNETEDRLGFNLSYTRTIVPLLSFTSALGYQHETFEDGDLTQKTASLELGLNYEWTRDLALAGLIGRSQRNSDAQFSEYEENWLLVRLDYRFF